MFHPPECIRTFKNDERGGLTIFVLVIFTLLLVIGGMAVDFQRYELARADLQDALDRGVLAAANSYQKYDTASEYTVNEQATGLISQYMASRNYRVAGMNLDVSVQDLPGGRRVSATASEPVDTIFLRMAGWDRWDVPVRSAAVQAVGKLEITLILDVTGSMGNNSTSAEGTKLEQLKGAAKEFLDTVLADENTSQTLISIVPFSQNVALPQHMADVYGFDRDHTYSSCVDYHDIDFSTTAIATGATHQQSQHFIDGRVGGENRFHCPVAQNAVTPFSNDLDALKDAVDDLTIETWTAMYMGMKWGSALLDPTARPLVTRMIADGKLSSDFAGWPHAWSDTSVRKITVLMSDGANTRLNEIRESAYAMHSPSWWNVNRPTSSEKYSVIHNDVDGVGDQRLGEICDRAKLGANSTVYTIGFEVSGSSSAQDALLDCASSPSTYYLVEGVEISTAFKNIADEIVNLKLIN